MQRATLAAALAAAVAAALWGASAHALRLPAARHCRVFPANNAWNERVDKLPVSADSAQLINSIGLDAPVHADFGSGRWNGGPIGIPFDVVSSKTALHRVAFDYADESDRVRYPIPQHVHIEGGAHATGDRHAILVDKSNCRLYELYDLRHTKGSWKAGSGAVWSLHSNHLRPAGWTSADAAGLPIFPGSPAGTRSRGGRSTMRSASPRRGRVAPTSIRLATTPRARATRRCRRWACGCG